MFKMVDWHNLIIAYLAGRKKPASSTDIKRHMEKRGITKTLPAIGTACKKTLSDVLICHDNSLYYDDGTVRKPRYQYSLKNDAATFQKLVLEGTYIRGSVLKTVFLKSNYCSGWIPYLVDEFAASFANLKLTMLDILHADASPEEFEQIKKIDDYQQSDFRCYNPSSHHV
jgi:hypothetical protein